MDSYPLVIRNRIPLFYRGFMIVWLGSIAATTFVALRDGVPETGRWWPFILAGFWAVGLFGLAWALDQELSEIRIPGPRSIHIRRGKAFRRVELWTDRARFWIEDTKDSDGDPYFKLWMDAPEGPLTVREGHQRAELEITQARIEAAVKGRTD